MDCSVHKDYKPVLDGTKYCKWEHYLIVAHTTHLPLANFFLFDTSIGREICYNGKGVPW